MQVSIIVIGDELLIGQVTDTNSGDIARRIAPSGWSVNDIQVIGDNATAIQQAIDRAFSQSDVVLTTGGLGPTKDDITKGTLCNYFGGELYENKEVLENVKRVVSARHLKLNPLTAAQAIVPSSCTVIQNEVGTAPLMWFEKDDKVLVAMPGVPFETRHMFDTAVWPRLLQHYHSDTAIEHRTLIITGHTESEVAGMLANWEDALPEYAHLAYLPKPGIIRLRLDGWHTDATFIANELNRLHDELIAQFEPCHILSTEDLSPAEVLINELRKRNLTLSTAESCTGGNIAHEITAIAGASDVFNGSIVAYSNSVKNSILHVSSDDITTHGAVSIPVVEQMAIGATQATATQCAIATSGIAGPTGGSPEKPVGTVCIAVAVNGHIKSATYHFPGNRQRVIDRATRTAFIELIYLIRDFSE
jgi:nicotinamide-nucleotide amidase